MNERGSNVSRRRMGWVRLLVSAAALVGLGLAAAGCDGLGRKSKPPAAAPSVSRIADVPVPQGFKFDVGQSNDRVTGSTRVVSHLYKGGIGAPNVAETTDFYRQMMPGSGWQKMEESFNDKVRRFIFAKGNENCYVSIWDSWGTKVLVQVYPKGAKPPEPALESFR